MLPCAVNTEPKAAIVFYGRKQRSEEGSVLRIDAGQNEVSLPQSEGQPDEPGTRSLALTEAANPFHVERHADDALDPMLIEMASI